MLHNKFNKFYLIIIFTIFISPGSLSQVLDSINMNIRLEIKEGTVTIFYDLIGPTEIEYNIGVAIKREKDKNFIHIPQDIAGDNGKGYYAGKNRKIIWNYSKEFPAGLEDAYFELTTSMLSKPVEAAEVNGKGSNLIYYLLGGTAVIFGAGALILSKSASSPENKELPDAPILR